MPDPERSGLGTAIIVNGTPYVVDLGTGVVRPARGVLGLDTVALRIGCITHLHSDDTLGLPDAKLTPWIVGRKEPLTIKRIPAAIRRADECRQAGSEEQLLREVRQTSKGRVVAVTISKFSDAQ